MAESKDNVNRHEEQEGKQLQDEQSCGTTALPHVSKNPSTNTSSPGIYEIGKLQRGSTKPPSVCLSRVCVCVCVCVCLCVRLS